MPAVGKRLERAIRTASCATRNWASAARTFWFEMLTCSSKAFNCGSFKTSHHFPRAAASLG